MSICNSLWLQWANTEILSSSSWEQYDYKREMKENLDLPKNTIHLDNVLKLKDKRTTIMIRHIPNKYTLDILMQEINVNFEGKYDVLYLPIDFVHNSNLRFAFINFIDPMHLIYFYD